MVRRWLGTPLDGASVGAFRLGFGLLMAVSAVRFVASGWVDTFFAQRTTHFRYWGFEWVPVLPAEGMAALVLTSGAAALLLGLGVARRAAALVFLVAFAWVELADVTNYLNHYVLATFVAAILLVAPSTGPSARDVLGGTTARATVPRWVLHLLRFQFAVVYVYAGLAKLEADWLVHGQPLGIWLAARDDFPVLGPLFRLGWVPVAMSWAGCLHDLLVVPLLLVKRTRPWAFAALLVFHALTGALFTIGIFPILMPLGATLFFEPGWPRALLDRRGRRAAASPPPPVRAARPVSRATLAALTAWALVQVAVPLRAHAYGPGVLWHEQGMRWSWRVMLREKNGSVTYRVSAAGWPHERRVSPRQYLTSYQEREMAGQPDLVLQLAHHVAADFRARGARDVQVRADAFASLNGRPPARLVDPDVDLARVRDGLGRADWILPPPAGPPLRSAGVRAHAALRTP